MYEKLTEQRERLDAIDRMLRRAETIEGEMKDNRVKIDALRESLSLKHSTVRDMIACERQIAELVGASTNLATEHRELHQCVRRANETYERDYPSDKEWQ